MIQKSIKKNNKFLGYLLRIITATYLTSCALIVHSQSVYDSFGRLINYPEKTEVKCPTQNTNTGVLCVIGQSNSANGLEKMFYTKYPTAVFNYFNGKC